MYSRKRKKKGKEKSNFSYKNQISPFPVFMHAKQKNREAKLHSILPHFQARRVVMKMLKYRPGPNINELKICYGHKQQTREWTGARKMLHVHHNKDPTLATCTQYQAWELIWKKNS